MGTAPPEFPVFVRALADAVGADAVTLLPPPYRPHAALRVGGTLQVLVRQHVESCFTASLVRGPGFPVTSAEDAIAAAAGPGRRGRRPPRRGRCDR